MRTSCSSCPSFPLLSTTPPPGMTSTGLSRRRLWGSRLPWIGLLLTPDCSYPYSCSSRTPADLDPPTIYHVCQDYDMVCLLLPLLLCLADSVSSCYVCCSPRSATSCAPSSSSSSPPLCVTSLVTRGLSTGQVLHV